MKIGILCAFLFLINSLWAQGKFAGGYAALIGKKHKNEKDVPMLAGFTLREGTLLSAYDDPTKLTGSWYTKGNLIVAIFEQLDEGGNLILDVLEVKNVLPNQILAIGTCQDGEEINAGFVALVKQTNEERFKATKAWNFNRDKIRLEAWNPAKVTCIGMVGDD